MAKRYWETLLKDKDKDTPMPWWLKIIFGVGYLIGIGFSILIIVPVFLFRMGFFSSMELYSIPHI